MSNACKTKPVNINKDPDENPEIKQQRDDIVDCYAVKVLKARKKILYKDLIIETANMIPLFRA